MGTPYLLQCIGVIPCIPCLRGDRHGGRGEVLYLFEVEVQLFGNLRQLCHVLLRASRMAGDEVGDDLLVEVLLLVDTVEDALEVIEQLEGRLAHEPQHPVAGMLGSHLQSAADMPCDEFPGIVHGGTVGLFILAVMQDEVVTHPTANETLLDAGQCVDGAVDVEQGTVVGIQVRTNLRMDTAGSLAFLTRLDVTSFHAVHIGRGTAEVREITFEVRHLHHLPDFPQDTLLGAAGNELTLMGGDGAEGTAAETATVDVHAVLDHLVGRNAFPLVFRMRLTGIGEVERSVQLLCGHRRIGRVDDD